MRYVFNHLRLYIDHQMEQQEDKENQNFNPEAYQVHKVAIAFIFLFNVELAHFLSAQVSCYTVHLNVSQFPAPVDLQQANK